MVMKELEKRVCQLETRGDHPNHSIIKISKNTYKRLGDLQRLAVTQVFTERHLLKLV